MHVVWVIGFSYDLPECAFELKPFVTASARWVAADVVVVVSVVTFAWIPVPTFEAAHCVPVPEESGVGVIGDGSGGVLWCVFVGLCRKRSWQSVVKSGVEPCVSSPACASKF